MTPNEPQGEGQENVAADNAARPSPDGPAGNAGDLQTIEQLRAELNEAQQEVLRAHAELENYRKRVRREMDEERKYAALPLMRDLLPTVDDLNRAIDAAQAQSDSALVAGVRMVLQQLLTVLEKHNCHKIESAGVTFDPHLHDAIGQMPSNDVPAGTVAHVAVEGYRLHDRVIRPSQVLVSTGPADGGNPNPTNEN